MSGGLRAWLGHGLERAARGALGRSCDSGSLRITVDSAAWFNVGPTVLMAWWRTLGNTGNFHSSGCSLGRARQLPTQLLNDNLLRSRVNTFHNNNAESAKARDLVDGRQRARCAASGNLSKLESLSFFPKPNLKTAVSA